MPWLKQSTTVTVDLGPYLDRNDGLTALTGITPVVRLSKGNAAFVARNSATAVTHDEDGWYRVELNGTDTGTLGPLVTKSHLSATYLPVWREFLVVPAHVYDGFISGTGFTKVDLAAVDGSTGGITSFRRSLASIPEGTVGNGASTTSIPTSSLAPSAVVADQFKGRIMVFDENTTTAALRGQMTDITANDSAGLFTVTALTTAPVNGDVFTIL
jgi:hypothetical protein